MNFEAVKGSKYAVNALEVEVSVEQGPEDWSEGWDQQSERSDDRITPLHNK